MSEQQQQQQQQQVLPCALPLSESAVDQCQFQSWYPLFRKHTIKSEVIPLPAEFVEYLNEDGVEMPDSLAPTQPGDDWLDGFEDANSEDSDEEDTDKGAANGEEGEPAARRSRRTGPFFPELIQSIEAAIARLGGAVFPKLNWSSPKDASWIACGETLKCQVPGDVLLLLKSSDFTARDLNRPYEQCTASAEPRQRPDSFHLVLRKWSNLFPSREFRCFIRSKELVGVCQRDHTNFYDHLAESKQQHSLKEAISDFFEETVLPTFPGDDYVCDVYVDTNDRVWIVDFGPFGGFTDPLLFEWNELEPVNPTQQQPSPSQPSALSATQDSNLASSTASVAVESKSLSDSKDDSNEFSFQFRVVESPTAVLPSIKMYNRLPKDVSEFDLSNAEAIERFAAQIERNANAKS